MDWLEILLILVNFFHNFSETKSFGIFCVISLQALSHEPLGELALNWAIRQIIELSPAESNLWPIATASEAKIKGELSF